MLQRQSPLPLAETEDLAEQQHHDYPAEQRLVALVAEGAVLTEEVVQPSMEAGVGNHEGLYWCDNHKLSWLPANSMA